MKRHIRRTLKFVAFKNSQRFEANFAVFSIVVKFVNVIHDDIHSKVRRVFVAF